jgi:BirA family biotin operon repressor/biotin-[acetyl-CoA-carboxylase] ligase
VYDDLDRPPLRAAALTRALAPDGWRVEVMDRATSTNAVVAERVRSGEPAGLVVVAEEQSAGRGRLDRVWVSPPRAGLTFSLLLRPSSPPSEWPWLPLLAGLAVARALRSRAGVPAVLKWPNDVLVEGRKVCGLLAEAVAGGLVVGIGLNVTTRPGELPHPEATSLELAGARTTDRDTLLRAVLREVTEAMGDVAAAKAGYRELCSTVGAVVRIELPGDTSVEGLADAVDDDGRLVVDGTAYGVGDVVHLRPLQM